MSELRLHWERVKSHWKHTIFLLGLTAALAAVTSCGSSNNSTTTPTITVSCTPTDVTVSSTSQCTATVQNLSSTLVNWSVGGSSTGTITSGGLYTAPSAVPTNNVVTITATSQVQSTLTATQNLTIEAATAIATVTCVDPATNTSASVVESNHQLACTATTSTGATVAVNWTVTNANKLGGNVGAISSQGIYTAPLVPPPGQTVTITATSQSVSTITSSVNATVVFGSSVLSGSYVFSTSGHFPPPPPSGVFWARAGSFSAGGGVINGGVEDTNQGGSPNIVTQLRTFSGSYSVGADGRGTMQFCESPSAGTPAPTSCPSGSTNATAFFRIAVVSPQQVQIIEFSRPGTSAATVTASGDMVLQDPSVPGAGNANLSGTYSFDFAGVSNAAAEESVVGQFSSNGVNAIGPGNGSLAAQNEMDTNTGTPSGAVPIPTASYSISGGRGTVTLNGLTFRVYPISASRARFIEIDPVPPSTTASSILLGDAYKQQTSSTCKWSASSALSGTTVLETLGSASTSAVADVGAFTASSGAVTNVSIDENRAGAYTPPGGSTTGTYVMDTDASMNQCGRGTLSLPGHSYVFYVISPSSAVLQETTSGTVAHGLLVPTQSESLADGSYAFQFQGTDGSGQTEDFLGQFTTVTASGSSTATLNGTLDLNDSAATQTGLPITSGTFPPAGPGNVRSTATFPIVNPVNATRSLVLYLVSPTLFYALNTDSTGTAIGVIANQF